MEIHVRPIRTADFAMAHAMQREYLDAETLDDFMERVRDNPGLYLVAVDGNEVIGVCYGRVDPGDRSGVQLRGIAVTLDETKGYARHGIGSRMLGAFAAAAQARGCTRIGVGSADDPKVESFYRKNGFSAVELVAKSLKGEELERIPVDDYASGTAARERLRARYVSRAREVIFIFEKALPSAIGPA